MNKSLENKAMAIIGEPLTNSGKSHSTEPCSKCKENLTEDTIKKIKAIPPSYTVRLTQMLPSINKYMKAFGISDNCLRKAHFVGQVTKETGFWNMFEDFNHSKTSLDNANFPNRAKIKEVVLKNKDKATTEEDQIKVANIGYGTGTKAPGLGNNVVAESDWADPTKDGYKYRGRGLIQLTGRSNYTNFQAWYDKHKKAQGWTDLDFVEDPDLLSVKQEGNKISNPEMLVLSAIYFWDKNNMNTLADAGETEKHTNKLSNKVNSGQTDDARAERHRYFTTALRLIKDYDLCSIDEANRIPLTETDIITYHIYANGRRIEKQMPKNNEKHPTKRRYFYYDKLGNKHHIGDFEIIKVKKRDGSGTDIKLHKADSEGNIEMACFSEDTFLGYKSKDGNVKAKVAKWELTDWNVEANNKGKRKYINPECLAGLLGAMLDFNIDYLTFRGASNEFGGPYPSKSHKNGVRTDIAYFNKSGTAVQVLLADKELALQLNVDFVNALIDYGYSELSQLMTEEFIPYGETKKRYLVKGMKQITSPRHNNHLHIGGFDFGSVLVRNDK